MIGDPRVVRALQACDGPWTFIDETFSTNSATHPERNFYAMAALQVARAEGQVLREAIVRFTGGESWHTTKVYNAGREADISEMLRIVAAHVEWNVQVVHTPVEGIKAKFTEPVRAMSLRMLLAEIARGRSDQGLVIMDQRGDWRVMTADDNYEPLLQAVDLVAWSLQRAIAWGDIRWFEQVESLTTVIHAPTGEHLDVTAAAKAATSHTPDGSGRLNSSGRRDSMNPASFTALGSTLAGSDSNIDRQGKILSELVRQASTKAAD